jgi:cellulose synthase/poly-beta-1,6-N-acetylglucosamine synthase-like glycosyltransferase
MITVDAIFVLGLWGIWIMLIYWIFLSIGSIRYIAQSRRDLPELLAWNGTHGDAPFVSILVPAHNEAVVIQETVRALANQDYPKDSYEIIVVNDGSTDDTGQIIRYLGKEIPNLVCHDVPAGEGGKGKSRTLNIGMRCTKGTLIAVFDADNTPEPNCLRLLVATLLHDTGLAAVNAKVRTRNRDASLLTRFINLEFIYFQWLFQGGRWQWFRLSMLMGTGYVIYRDVLDILGGFDEHSLVDDTEMSLRIFRGHRRIRWVPYALTWEQEPESLLVWWRQRTRWAMGNLSVTWKYLPGALTNPYPLGLEMLTFALNYIVFLPALLASDSVFLLGLSGVAKITVPGPYLYLWGIAVVIYTFHMSIFIHEEDNRSSNYLLAVLSYFTYAQLFIFVLLRAFFGIISQRLLGFEMRWAKTVRHKEKRP